MNPDDKIQQAKASLSYRAAGVDIDAGNRLVEKIKPVAAQTARQGMLSGLGGFGALFELPLERYRRPVLVAGTDGVGTKLKLAIELGRHETVGIDLVAMCVNDLIVQGAEPLFFLDYYAADHLDVDAAAEVIQGIGRGCRLAGAALAGGETAEMPGMYQPGDYDLAGFCVGIVEKDLIIDGSSIQAGNALIGLASSGAHSNGYSLIRKIIETTGTDLSADIMGKPLGETLLAATRIYVQPLLKLIGKVPVHGMAHITGGGLVENLPRIMPDNVRPVIDRAAWPSQPIFDWLQEQGNLSSEEMLRTFNCGIGMVVCVPPGAVDASIDILRAHGETAWRIGTVEQRPADGRRILIRGVS